MASVQKLEMDVEIKAPAQKFWETVRDSTVVFPKYFPELYKSIEVLEGDGKSVGTVRLITFGEEGSPLIRTTKEKTEIVDEENKKLSYSIIEGDVLKYYSHFKGHLEVSPKDDGCFVKWSCEFEKVSDEVPDPVLIRDFAVKNFKDLDEYLHKE